MEISFQMNYNVFSLYQTIIYTNETCKNIIKIKMKYMISNFLFKTNVDFNCISGNSSN